jgi:ABC-2 type transport system ATP-binding protein
MPTESGGTFVSVQRAELGEQGTLSDSNNERPVMGSIAGGIRRATTRAVGGQPSADDANAASSIVWLRACTLPRVHDPLRGREPRVPPWPGRHVTDAIRTIALRKVYPAPGARRGGPASEQIVALAGLDLTVGDGEFFGLLGPNGAGKTTTVGILTTRVKASAGTALVAGVDVTTDAIAVRQRIGVVPQRPNPDRGLNVLENLVFHAAYFGVAHAAGTSRARELLEQLGIADKAQAKIDHLSGGQQQRLMIARALIHEPSVLFLDEPTVGLDPQARLALWDILRALHAQGRTIVMTTHYMEEADRLCERVAIVDRGRLLALDTPGRLKARAPGGTLVELALDGDAAPSLERVLALPGVSSADVQDHTLRVYTERGGELIPALIREAGAASRTVRDIHLSPPSLETLFISLTGRKLD